MIIECRSCHARFRLDDSKIRGKGARVKCRKCGEGIIVLRDDDTGIVSQEPVGEGSLDLGSVLRESSGDGTATPEFSSPNNLIPFPGPARNPETTADKGKDEVDLAFDQLLSETVGHNASDPPIPDAPPATSGNGSSPEEMPAEQPPVPEPPALAEIEAQDAGMPVDSPLEFAPEETLELPPLLPDGSGADEAVPSEEGFLIGNAVTLDFPNEGSRTAEAAQGADISDSIAPAPIDPDIPAPSEPDTASFPPAADFVPPPAEDLPLEGNVTPPPAPRDVDTPPYREPGPAATAPLPAVAGPYREPSPAGAPATRSASSRPLAAGAALLLALLAAAGYFGFTASGRESLGKVLPRLAALVGGGRSAAPVSRYEVKNVIGYYESGAASPRILVIKGQVTNLSKVGKSSIRMHAALLDDKDQVLAEKAVYAGNILSGAKLKTGDREALEKALDNPLGERLSNMDVLPGKTVPFMVLFFDAPANIDSYRLEARDNE